MKNLLSRGVTSTCTPIASSSAATIGPTAATTMRSKPCRSSASRPKARATSRNRRTWGALVKAIASIRRQPFRQSRRSRAHRRLPKRRHMEAQDPLPPRPLRGISEVAHSHCRDIAVRRPAARRGHPFQRRDNAFGRGFVGGHVSGQSDLSQRADWLWSACNLACQAQCSDEGRLEIDRRAKPRRRRRPSPVISTRSSHLPSAKRRSHASTVSVSGASRMAIIGQGTVSAPSPSSMRTS